MASLIAQGGQTICAADCTSGSPHVLQNSLPLSLLTIVCFTFGARRAESVNTNACTCYVMQLTKWRCPARNSVTEFPLKVTEKPWIFLQGANCCMGLTAECFEQCFRFMDRVPLAAGKSIKWTPIPLAQFAERIVFRKSDLLARSKHQAPLRCLKPKRLT
ncbi:hypothetical protein Poly41_41950 [Novipirellula artificiosorum]|uniref:Uncharacterized protein n=1 Tax=Novipirellula artificiosorum TaxID=2528016 RepID=A0A5C6DH24_9BACT|nr:hypothetical protein Poly41_41950 [Novipirellula artificiosorum]